MKRTLILIILLAATQDAMAQKSPSEELLEYSITHPSFSVPVATMTMTAKQEKNTLIRLAATIKSNELIKTLYRLDASYFSYINPEKGMNPTNASHAVLENRYWRTVDYTWKPYDNSLHVKVYKKGTPDIMDEEVYGGKNTRDLLSLIWKVRWLPYKKDGIYEIGFLVSEKTAIPVMLSSFSKQEILLDGQPVNTIEVLVVTNKKDSVTILLTDDKDRTPLAFTAQTEYGHIEGKLIIKDDIKQGKKKEILELLRLDPNKHTVSIQHKKTANTMVADSYRSYDQYHATRVLK